ncbi:MAG: hypothetical protein AB1894_15605 [Chloroflexota bacterium]
MHNTQTPDRDLETIAWGLLFVLWGLTVLFDFIPAGVGLAGTGLILLGLNAVRSLSGIPARSGTTTIGILALVWGGLELADVILPLPFELSDWAIFAILLIVLGGILLGRELLGTRKTDAQGPSQSMQGG